MTEARIQARHVTVDFPVYNASHRSLKKSIINMTTGGRIAGDAARSVCVRALDDVSLDLGPGDRVGLVGHNGAGKTTLLRVLAGVYAPTAGTLDVRGRIASLLDISVGMEDEATGYENILLRGVMMGLTPAAIRARIDEIAAFSELGEYMDMPVRTYSSGMRLRLAFSVSTCIDADIILMDEWLSVGDAAFNEKASRRLEALVERSAILVIASHDPALLARVCNMRLALTHGKLATEPACAS